jgi:hypothetical protein
MSKSKVVRLLLALAIILVGIVLSFIGASWLKIELGLPSLAFRMKSGTPADLTDLALASALLIAYLSVMPKLLRITHDELSKMLSGG